MTKNLTKYEREGERAFKLHKPRESCRYKKPKIVAAWQAGWDSRAALAAKAAAAAKVPRWKDYVESWRTGELTESSLLGDAPRLTVHRSDYEPGMWFVSCREWGIKDVRLTSTDIAAAKLEAVQTVRAIAEKRLTKLSSIADTDGRIREVSA